MILLLSCAVERFFSYHNLQLLHNNKKVIHVKDTRLSLITGYGVTTPFLGRAAAITGTVVLLLTAIGSFSIDGSSRRGTRTMIARRVVLQVSRPEEVVDYSKHVSADGFRVSGTYVLALAASHCDKINNTNRSWYSMMTSTDALNLNSIEYPPSVLATNISCRLQIEGFQDEVIQSGDLLRNDSVSDGCTFKQSRLTVRESAVWSETAQIDGCELYATQTWCANYSVIACVTQTKHPKGFSTVHWTSRSVVLRSSLHWEKFYSKIPDERRALQSLAYLVATRVEPRFERLRRVASSFVKIDEPIQELAETIEETNINIWLLVFTAGISLFLTFLFVLLAFAAWRKNMICEDLRGFNAMSSAMNFMACAASIACGDEDSEIPGEGILVGVSRRVPYVGPLTHSEEQELQDGQGVMYDENEIEGRHVYG